MSVFTIGAKPPPSSDDPIAMLRACHRRIEQNLATLARVNDALPSAEALAALAGALEYFDHAGARHTEDEEFSLFPRVAADETNELIARLHTEHRELEAIYLSVRTVGKKLLEDPGLGGSQAWERAGDELAVHVRALAAGYAEHMRLEEELIFPLGDALDAPQKRAIGIEMRLRRG